MANEPLLGSQLIAAVDSAGVPKRVVLSDDDPPRLLASLGGASIDIGDVSVLSIAAGDNNIGNVDIASALPAGTNAIGKLAANSGVDIGDVDVASIAAGDNNIGNVDIASIAAGTNAIGKLAANSGVDIGDVDVTSIAAGTNRIGAVRVVGSDDTVIDRMGTNGDGQAAASQSLLAGAINMVYNGTDWDRQRSGSATSTDPHYAAARVVKAGGAITLQASVAKTATFIGTAKTGLGGFTDLIVTLDVTAAERDSADETYDFYITAGDGVSSWDIAHFPQILTTGAKRYTARISGRLLPQNVTTASPGVAANDTATFKTDTSGSDQGVRTLGAGVVRHGPWGDRINHELVIAGTIVTGITYSITICPK